MKKYLLNFIFTLTVLGFVFVVFSCDNQITENSLPKDVTDGDIINYEIGSVVTVDGIEYQVINNDFEESANRSVIGDLLFVEYTSIKNAKNIAKDIFGKNILLLRTCGKVTVPQGDEDLYSKAREAVLKGLPPNVSETDYFSTNSTSSDKKLYYRDIYNVYARDLSFSGSIEVIWESQYKLKDAAGNDVTLTDVLKEFDEILIRSNCPYEYKVRDNEKLFIYSRYYSNDIVNHEVKSLECSRYFGDYQGTKKLCSAAQEVVWYDDEGKWIRSEMFPLAAYSKESRGVSACLRVDKDSCPDKTYRYFVLGAANVKPQTKTSYHYFSFDETNKYSSDSIEITDVLSFPLADVTLYDSETLPYDTVTRQVPVDFVLNEDGSVSFGKKVYEWIENWRDFIVENNELADYYN